MAWTPPNKVGQFSGTWHTTPSGLYYPAMPAPPTVQPEIVPTIDVQIIASGVLATINESDFDPAIYSKEIDQSKVPVINAYVTVAEIEAWSKTNAKLDAVELKIHEKPEPVEVSFDTLVGPHWLTGWDHGITPGNPQRYEEDASHVRFVLDGVTYRASEDPSDGYRSCLGSLAIEPADAAPVPHIPPTYVIARKSSNVDHDVLEFVTEHDALVLEIGTSNSDDYYPSFVGAFYPENLPVNAGKPGARHVAPPPRSARKISLDE